MWQRHKEIRLRRNYQHQLKSSEGKINTWSNHLIFTFIWYSHKQQTSQKKDFVKIALCLGRCESRVHTSSCFLIKKKYRRGNFFIWKTEIAFYVFLGASASVYVFLSFSRIHTCADLKHSESEEEKNWKISLRWWKMGNSRMILCENLLILFYVKLPDEWLRGLMMTRHWTKNGTRKYNFSIKLNNVSYKTLKYVKSALNNSILHTHTHSCAQWAMII